jgi:hypothetical protein
LLIIRDVEISSFSVRQKLWTDTTYENFFGIRFALHSNKRRNVSIGMKIKKQIMQSKIEEQ